MEKQMNNNQTEFSRILGKIIVGLKILEMRFDQCGKFQINCC